MPAVDDRGDGLAGVELSAVDPGHAMDAAARLGLAHDTGTITICGVRFTLTPAG